MSLSSLSRLSHQGDWTAVNSPKNDVRLKQNYRFVFKILKFNKFKFNNSHYWVLLEFKEKEGPERDGDGIFINI